MELLQSILLYVYIIVLELIFFQYAQFKLDKGNSSISFSNSKVYRILKKKFIFFFIQIVAIELSNYTNYLEIIRFFETFSPAANFDPKISFGITESILYFISIVSLIAFIFDVFKNKETLEFYKKYHFILALSSFVIFVFTISFTQYIDHIYLLLSILSLVALLFAIKVVINKKTALCFTIFVVLLNFLNLVLEIERNSIIDLCIKANTVLYTLIAFSLMNFYKLYIMRTLNKGEQENTSSSDENVHEVLGGFITKDKLTSLYNGESLKKHAKEFLDRGCEVCLVMINIDNFKFINTYYGFEVGDKVLIAFAKFLQSLSGKFNVYRFNADQFSILVNSDVEEAMSLCDSINSSLKGYQNKLKKYELSVSMGLSESHGEKSYYSMLKESELALSHAKEHGKNRVCIFHESMIMETQKRLEMEKLIRKRIITSDFILYCQPKMSIKKRSIAGGEILIRMKNDHGGFVPPDQFITVAEESGLICQIDNIILHKAFKFIQELQFLGFNLPLSINISSQEFLRTDFNKKINFLIDYYDINKNNFVLEITETSLISDIDKGMTVANQINDMGIKLSLDDFGTGYSSINYLIHLPIHEVKIDKGLTSKMLETTRNKLFFKYLVKMLYSIDMDVVVEGVETYDEYIFLEECGSDIYQGYYSYKPMPISEFKHLLLNAS